jgi:hypothetical protein
MRLTWKIVPSRTKTRRTMPPDSIAIPKNIPEKPRQPHPRGPARLECRLAPFLPPPNAGQNAQTVGDEKRHDHRHQMPERDHHSGAQRGPGPATRPMSRADRTSQTVQNQSTGCLRRTSVRCVRRAGTAVRSSGGPLASNFLGQTSGLFPS